MRVYKIVACGLLVVAKATPAADDASLVIAIATTLDSSGFAAAITENFAGVTTCDMQLVASTSAHALELLKRGDVALAITHAPQLEQEFISLPQQRIEIMSSEFVLAGPATDPADLLQQDLVTAFTTITESRAKFVSRGDNSGTHQMEQELWQEANLSPTALQENYLASGSNASTALQLAQNLAAYTLTDKAVLLALRQTHIDLEILARDTEPVLHNIYSLLLPTKPSVCAQIFAGWLQSSKGWQMIAEFAIAGEQVYTPRL